METIYFPWEHQLLPAEDTLPQHGIVWLLSAKPDTYLLSCRASVWKCVHVYMLGRASRLYKNTLHGNRPGRIEEDHFSSEK